MYIYIYTYIHIYIYTYKTSCAWGKTYGIKGKEALTGDCKELMYVMYVMYIYKGLLLHANIN